MTDLRQIRRQLRVVSFDLWGTLFDDAHLPQDRPSFRERRIRHFQKRLRREGIAVDGETAKQAYFHARSTFDAYWRRQQAFDAEIGISAMLDFLGVRVEETCRKDLVRYFQTVVNRVTLRMYPGTREALERLHTRFELALICDTGWTPARVLRLQLRRNRVLHLFSLLLFSDEVGVTKPHARMFLPVLEHFRVQPEQCLHVGDIPFTDLLGARRAGFHTAWIRKPAYEAELTPENRPDVIVESVAELAESLLE